MKVTTFVIVLLFTCCFAFAGLAQDKIRVHVRDEQGQLLMSTQAVRLSRGRVAVPAAAYRRIGLFVKGDVKAKRVSVGLPETDSIIRLHVGSYQVVRNSPTEKIPPDRYDAPVAVLRQGEFYVNASVMRSIFSDMFSTTWDSTTHTVTLQRSKTFGEALQKLN